MNTETESNEVILDEHFNPLLISTGQYELFMSGGKVGIDALSVYLHLQYTARRQHTNQVWANNKYIQAGVSMGELRLKAAKVWLKEKGIIEYVQPKDSATKKFGKTYIRLNYIHTAKTVEKAVNNAETHQIAGGLVSAPPVSRTTGNSEQMLKLNNEMLKVKKEGEGEEPPPSFHSKIGEALNKHAAGTMLSATTCKAIDEFAEKNGEKALNAVVKSYVDEKTPEKIRKYVNKDLIERFADYTPPPPERATCNKCGQYVEVEGICTDCADAERTRVEDEKHRIEHPEEYENVACSECGDNHMRMSLTNGLCFTCRQDAKIAQ